MVIITEKEYNELDSARRKALLDQAKTSRKAIQERSEANGLNNVSMEEIVADIAEYRKEKRGG